jgi:hypothetical protein
MEKGGGMSVISYRTKMDRKTIEKFAVQRLKYRSVNAFIDHAVQKTLMDELGAGSHAAKIAQEVQGVVLKHFPLRFQPASSAEEKAMLKDLDELRVGHVKPVRVTRILKGRDPRRSS